MAEERDYYEILGVSKNATDAELKSAFRRLVRKYGTEIVVNSEFRIKNS